MTARRRVQAALVAAAFALVGSACAAPLDLQGHRGARGLQPENSLPAFREALAVGVTTLELDLVVTSDDVLVVHHDVRLNPATTRDERGRWLKGEPPAMRELSYQQLQRYDVGKLQPTSAYRRRFPNQRSVPGTRIPRLLDVLALAEKTSGGAIRYNVETKLSPLEPELSVGPERFAELVVATLRKAGVLDRTTVQSFDWRTLQHVKLRAPQLATACLTSEHGDFDTIRPGLPGASPWTAELDIDQFGGSVPRLVAAAGCDVWSPSFEDVSLAGLREAQRRGLRVVVWTVNDDDDIRAMLRMRVDGIISDYPDRVRRIMRQRGLALPASYRAGR
jgi:glycerophosphoryl diester phosphodiesterase